MKIKRKDLKRLIENYLLEQEGEESAEEGEEASDAPEEGEESAEEGEGEVDDTAANDQSSDDKKSVDTSQVISNSLEGALKAIKDLQPANALSLIKSQANTALKNIEVKVKDVPKSILDLMMIDDKDTEKIVNLQEPSSGAIRKAIADQQKSTKA